MLPSRRRRVAAAAAGVGLAGATMVAFSVLLDSFVDRKGQEEVVSVARRALAIADSRLGQAATSLRNLANREVDSCSEAHLDALRFAAVATGAIKSLSILGPDGASRCSDLGIAFDPVEILSTHRIAAGDELWLDIVRMQAIQRPMIRMRKPFDGGHGSLAALISGDLLVPAISGAGAPLTTHLSMSGQDGTLIGEAGRSQHDVTPNDNERFIARLDSKPYGIVVTVLLSRAAVASAYADLRILGHIISGMIVVGILAFALLVHWSPRRNPMLDIERAFDAGEFVPYYQPILDIGTGRLRGAEVLARWRKRDGTVVPPGAFIPLLESNGLITELTCVLMRRVRDELGPALASRPHLKVGFNIAACHFVDEALVTDVLGIFERSPMRLSQIMLEVTERQPIESLAETRRVIATLQGKGVRFAIDDVGSGHSGLSYILKLGVDTIKIDKLFVDAIGTDGHSRTIIEMLVDLARNMRMDIVAEGIETFEQVMQLRELGIRTGQGFVFSPPLPGSSYLRLIEAIDPVKPEAADAAAGSAPRYLSARARYAAA